MSPIEEENEQIIMKQRESTAVKQPNSTFFQCFFNEADGYTPALKTEQGINVNSTEIKSHSEFLGILVASE